MRRKYTRRLKCSEPSCSEYAHYEYERRADYDKAVRENRPYTCCRHSSKGRVLTMDNPRVEWISEPNAPSKTFPNAPGTYFGSQGLLVAESYYAEAADFPIGTRIKVTAEVLLPTHPETEER